jgi:hypothetical protein
MKFRNEPVTADTPVLIVSAIVSSAPLTQLTDTKLRLDYLADSLRLWAASGVRKIVVCDGSTYAIASELANVIDLSALPCNLEVLGFINSVSNVSRFGKGYGEGEIVKYAITHSKLISEADCFVKCTGKLFVVNYWSVVRSFNGEFGAFYGGPLFWPQRVDTRFYIASKKFFLSNMIEAYSSVNDRNGIYLENVYFSVLINAGNFRWILNRPPKYVGVSGSFGRSYEVDKLSFFRLVFAHAFSLALVLRSYTKKIVDKILAFRR